MAKEKAPTGHLYEVTSEGRQRILKINYSREIYSPSIADNPLVMREIISHLLEIKNVDKISFIQKEEYVYDIDQTQILYEIAELYEELTRKVISFERPNDSELASLLSEKYDDLRRIIMHLMIIDPVSAYVELLRKEREEEIALKHPSRIPTKDREEYIASLKAASSLLGATKLIALARPYLAGYKLGDRDIYARIFSPTIKPYFIYTKLVSTYPSGAEEIDSYKIGKDVEVTIFRHPEEIRPLYYINPPEFRLPERLYDLLGRAREIIAKHKPTKEEFVDPRRTREVFYDIEKDLLRDLADSEGIKIKSDELELLAQILIRYTIGFGTIEVVLSDPKIQDLVINAPISSSPIFVVHQDYGECKTNIIPTPREGESWATKLRMISGRPLDEANPVLDTMLILPAGRARVAVIQEPLSSDGLAFAFRRHRTHPWTLPLFIHNKMMSPLAAGLLSFFAQSGRSMLIAGTRSAGKTSVLGALLLEIMRKYRVITIEDTEELPVEYMNSIGYNIESMKVRSAITGGRIEVPADEGIRVSLRLGDSCLILGEVRSYEAKALFEAMRVGALANVVAGTIHGESPYAVFDRVVNDLGVPTTSFKAVDIIAVANPVRTASGLESQKRLVNISEVRKFWTKDPVEEKGFAELMLYDAIKDEIKATDALIDGESEVLKSIAGRVREWAGNWPAVWDNVMLRANTKQELVDMAVKSKQMGLLEAPFVVAANEELNRISQAINKEVGIADSKRVHKDWSSWLRKQVK